MTTGELLRYLGGEPAAPATEPLAAWLAESPRFAAFATTYRDKIRKKLRTARDEHSVRDLLLELYAAYLLLRERRITLAYEPYSATKERGPDFAATWTTKTAFNVEVTRMRVASHDEPGQSETRLAEIIGGKLGQMLPAMPNVLLVFAPGTAMPILDARAALQQLQQRVEQRDERMLGWFGFRTPADFVRQRERLSAVVLRCAWDDPALVPPKLWLHPQAKQPLPASIRTLLQT